MALVDVTEYDRMAISGPGGNVMCGQEPNRASQQLAVTGTANLSAAFDDTTKFIRVHSDVPLRYAIGPTPVATATSPRIAAGTDVYFGVLAGHKISVILTT